MAASKSSKLLRIEEVGRKIGKTAYAVRGMVSNNQIPKPIKIGTKSVAWPEHIIDEWIAEKMADAGYSPEQCEEMRNMSVEK